MILKEKLLTVRCVKNATFIILICQNLRHYTFSLFFKVFLLFFELSKIILFFLSILISGELFLTFIMVFC